MCSQLIRNLNISLEICTNVSGELWISRGNAAVKVRGRFGEGSGNPRGTFGEPSGEPAPDPPVGILYGIVIIPLLEPSSELAIRERKKDRKNERQPSTDQSEKTVTCCWPKLARFDFCKARYGSPITSRKSERSSEAIQPKEAMRWQHVDRQSLQGLSMLGHGIAIQSHVAVQNKPSKRYNQGSNKMPVCRSP